ncbi:MAG: phosphate ABC transporter ATP-binding protein [Gemmatimonadota bacterium]|nr:phosphate ABC transporter ATP-binding protein [Gemmatimonadota bacterium]MDE2871693.1 phosphate ABC transporter ATP-binding protein [Gemmatimonadota bacterium]
MNAPSTRTEAPPVLAAEDLSVRFGPKTALTGVTLPVARGRVVSIIGPSASGKTTLLRAFNRLNELTPGVVTTGTVRFNGVDIHDEGVDPVEVRRRVGMVFQQATLFPKSVFDNVAFGPRASGYAGDLQELAEEVLTAVDLWSGAAGDLDAPALTLSAGQQQRLCIARTLALKPEVLLLDEPTSALDPAATARIESLIHALKRDYTVVLATHGRRQAARLSDMTAYLAGGELVEYGPTESLFTNPRDPRTESYLTGRIP